MSINYENMGVLEVLLICILAFSIVMICVTDVKSVNNVKGRLIAYITLLSYVMLKSIFYL